MPDQTWALLTPPNLGAIAVIQLPARALSKLTNRTQWDIGTLYLVEIPEIDEAVAVQITEDVAHIMPHGGLHILRKLQDRFGELGIEQTNTPFFPEALDDIEAAMLIIEGSARSMGIEVE